MSDTPQLENGYTQIANELMEELAKYRIPGEQMQCLLFLLRKTYGYHKLYDIISNTQFVVGTGLKKQNVNRSLKELIKKNIVIKNDDKYISSYGFNKKYKTWKSNQKRLLVIKIDSASNQKRCPQKIYIQKKVFLSDSIEFRLSSYLSNWIKKNNPSSKEPNIQTWCKHIDLMIRVDKRDPDEIKRVIEWCQKDAFWFKNILGTEKLRKQFDRLQMAMVKKTPIEPEIVKEYVE